ncbi:DUF1365 domain-containing protein [Roseibium aquae]|uniref:DUF1365 domain-containing protein n=1 Tax=Roseibium aquae TaxID=1323746 RepID=A0A916TIA7_9HYPH|nr:DUF1365 domain-containing protein [Roseibium aquae]GGB44649.1 DUF1365 domain-containing protein [Roseibium aquae]
MIKKGATSLRDNAAPPEAAAALYSGQVMHHRMKPKVHRFTYDVFTLLIDLDRLGEAGRASRLFSVGRWNMVAFNARDHGPRDGTDLRQHVESLLDAHGLPSPARILLLAYPRILGYVFNPLSVYYAYDRSGTLIAIVYEVRNTFGDLHTYVAPVEPGQMTDAGLRQDQAKEFYVSPFIDMDQHYHFRLLPPGRSVRVRILETDKDGPLLSATFSGEYRPFTTRNLLHLCLRIPLLTVKVMAAIHWEAFKLWRKRLKYHPKSASRLAGKSGTDTSGPVATGR